MLNSTLHPKTYCPKEDQTCTKLRDKDAAHFFEEEHDLIEEYENEVTNKKASNFNTKIIKKIWLKDPNYDWYEYNYGNYNDEWWLPVRKK